MDLSLKYERYIAYPREEAYSLFCDEKNRKSFNGILWGLTIAFGIVFMVTALFERSSMSSAIFYTIVFLIFLSLRLLFKKIFSGEKIRRRVIFTLFKVFDDIFFDKENHNIHIKSSKSGIVIDDKESGNSSNDDKNSYAITGMFFSIFLITLRLSKNEYIQLFTLSFGIPFIPELLLTTRVDIGGTIAQSIVIFILFIISITRESKFRKSFDTQYDYFAKKDSESLRMKKELDYARQIQVSMLPERHAIIGELEIAADSEPAKEVGGDYFDYFKISDSEIGIFICDVSGHGVASGLLLSGLRSGMHLVLEDTTNPKVVFEKLNRMIRKTQNRKMFVSAVFAVINTEKNICTLFNAGHLPPFKIDGTTLEIFKLKRHGITLGAMDDIAPESLDTEVIIDFKKTDKLIFYTDGVSEAMDSERNEYGFERLEQYLYSNVDKEPKDILHGLIMDVNNFTGKRARNDDLTILVIKRL